MVVPGESNMIISRNQMEKTQYRLLDEDEEEKAIEIEIDSSSSKRRKISSSSTEQVINNETCLSFPDLPDSKDYELPALNDNVDNGDDMSWLDEMIFEGSFDFEDVGLRDGGEGFSSSEGVDGGLVNGVLGKEGSIKSGNCDLDVGTSNGFSRESHDLSVSQSDRDKFGEEDSLVGEEYGVQDAGGRSVLDSCNGNGRGFDPNFDKSFGNSTCSSLNFLDSVDFPTGIDSCDYVQNRLSRESESLGHGVVLPCVSTSGNSRNNPIHDMSKKGIKSPTRGNGNWVPVGSDLVPRAEYCPDALVDYLLGAEARKSKDINHNSTVTKVRMHLSHLGWKIERKRDGAPKFRYISPDGKTEYSLIDVCKNLTQTMTQSHNSRIDNQNLINLPDKPRGSGAHLPRKPPISGFYETEIGRGAAGSSSLRSETSAIELREDKKELVDPDPDPDDADIEPEYCPQAVIDWCNYGSDRKKLKLVGDSTGGARAMTLKAKKHLLSVGWKLWYILKQKKKLELRYTSPRGKSYISLVRACKGCMEEEGLYGSTTSTEDMIAREKSKGPSSRKYSSGTKCTMGNENLLPLTKQSGKGYTELCGSTIPKEFECRDIQDKGIIRHQEKQTNMSFPLSSELPQSQTNVQDVISVPISCGLTQPLDHNVSTLEKKKGKPSKSISRIGGQLDGSNQTCQSISSKRARQVTNLSSMHQIPRTILSWLIDNNVVLPRAKVYCRGRKDHPLTEGRVTPEGIRCECCQKVFSLTKFEVHADSTSPRPAANIFLEGGRSLFECQMEMLGRKLNSFTSKPLEENSPPDANDEICSVCHYGGDILLCDQCPSSFHLSCLGLKDLPEGNWFCPSCRCRICDQGEFEEETENLTEKMILSCDQCEREYHVGCIRQRDQVKLESRPNGNWFCSKTCQKIFAGLHELRGKSFPVGVNNLSWTILKFSKDDYHKMDQSDIETLVEHHSKLNVALSVIHECFEPIKQPHSNRDLAEDVIFNRRSDLNRLNFRGFYTVILEKDDELISVATVRVHGQNMAEVPLVCTRVQYRQQGMCHILMNVIEKTLAELGVERLILPASLQMLSLWTTSFGFSMMTSFDRLKFLEYTFLSFQDTTMCQKILATTPTEKSTESRGNQRKFGADSYPNGLNVDMDRYSVCSEVIQADRVEQSEVVDQCNSGV